MKYTTYLFDFDYTLADSSRGIVICFRHVLERHGHTDISEESIKRTIGKTLEESFGILSGITDPDILIDYKKEYVKEADTYMTDNTFLFPETITVLNTLKSQGARIGIVSTKYRYRIRETVDRHFPKDFFDVIIGGEDVKRAKPDPQGIKKALRRLHSRKSETLYIGDSTVDAETARRTKVDFVGVLNGMTTREELAAYPHRQILSNLSLLPLVDKFNPYKHFPGKRCYLSPFLRKAAVFYRLFHQKQIRGRCEEKENPVSCICKNCGTEFQGNHCPRCGQNRHTPRFTMRNIIQNMLSGFFNIDNGFSRNLIELLYRPGYMIRDYLKGKRVHYYKPFQTLFVLAALYIMTVQLIDPEAIKLFEKETTEESTVANLIDDKEAVNKIENAFNRMTNNYFIENRFFTSVGNLMKGWINGNKAFSILALLPLFTIATRLSFRRTSVGRRLNLTENFFAQVYIACQILWISLLILPFTGKAHLNDVFDLSYEAIFVLFVWDYRQLFGLSWWKSFRHTITMFWYCFLGTLLISCIIIASIAYIIQGFK